MEHDIFNFPYPHWHGYDYRNYLPQAYDEGLTLLKRFEYVLKALRKMGLANQEMLDNYNELVQWIKDKGLEESVNNIFTEWVDDGTFADLINKTALKEINIRIDKIESAQEKTKLELKQMINTMISNLSSTMLDFIKNLASGAPAGVYPNTEALNQAFPPPKGDNHIYITSDDGNWNYFYNGKWEKGGVYQGTKPAPNSVTSEAIKDGSIANSDIGSINTTRVHDTYVDFMGAKGWNIADSQLTKDRNNIVLSKNKSGDAGISFPVEIEIDDMLNQAVRPLKFDFKYDIFHEGATGTVDLYLADGDTLKPPALVSSSNITSGNLTGTILPQVLLNAGLDRKFNVVLAIHGAEGVLLQCNRADINFGNSKGLMHNLYDLDKIEQLTMNGSAINNHSYIDSALEYANPFILFDKNDYTIFKNPLNNNTVLNKNNTEPFQAFGYKVHHYKQLSENQHFYINVDFKVDKADDYISTELWLADKDTKLFPVALKTSNDMEGNLYYTIQKPLADAWNLVDNDFYVLLLIRAGKAQLEANQFVANYSGVFTEEETIREDNMKVTKRALGDNLITKYSEKDGSWFAWNDAGGKVSFPSTEEVVFTTSANAGHRGLGYNAYLEYMHDLNTMFYCNYKIKSNDLTNNVNVTLFDGAGKIIAEGVTMTPNTRHFTSHHFAIDKDLLINKGITNNFKIVFTLHSANEYVSITDFNFSNQPAIDSYDTENAQLIDSSTIGRSYEMGYFRNVTSLPHEQHMELQWVTPYAHVDNDSKVTTIKFHSDGNINLTLKTATLDQYNLMVDSSKEYTYAVHAGYNNIDVSKDNIILKGGYYLFARVNLSQTEYTSDEAKYYPYLGQDDTHVVNENGYSGNAFWQQKGLFGFYYECYETSKAEYDDSGLQKQIDDLKTNYNPIIKRDDGALKRLKLDNTDKLYVEDLLPKNVVIVGNSLTSERGNIGMCASDQYHDWYHHFVTKYRTINPEMVVNPRFNFSSWESSTTSEQRHTEFDTKMKPLLKPDTGMVIIQLVDNVNNADRLATFGEDAKTLITNIKAVSPKATVIWVAGWFVDSGKMNLIKNATDSTDSLLVDITAKKDDPAYKGYLGMKRTGTDGETWNVTVNGEALHPGDLGMQYISDTIFGKLGL